MTTHEMIIILNEYVGVNMETINCMTAVNGYNTSTCESILYWATGWEDFDSYMADWEEENEISEFDE